jgi:hypothetical protein
VRKLRVERIWIMLLEKNNKKYKTCINLYQTVNDNKFKNPKHL